MRGTAWPTSHLQHARGLKDVVALPMLASSVRIALT